jgi:hypothetical protein
MEHPEKNISHAVNEALKRTGYDAEEEYFYRLNAELIERNRKRLDEQRRLLEGQERRKAHWMMCPKCGTQLKEAACFGVKADICGNCSGVFLDKGELEQILAAHGPKRLKELLKSWLDEATKPRESGIYHFPV